MGTSLPGDKIDKIQVAELPEYASRRAWQVTKVRGPVSIRPVDFMPMVLHGEHTTR
jgi:hypothetical protein